MSVYVPNRGYAKFTNLADRIVNINPLISSISPLTGPSSGSLLSINGHGFKATSQIFIGTYLCKTVSQSSSLITCRTSSFGAVTLKDGDINGITCGSCTFSIDNSV